MLSYSCSTADQELKFCWHGGGGGCGDAAAAAEFDDAHFVYVERVSPISMAHLFIWNNLPPISMPYSAVCPSPEPQSNQANTLVLFPFYYLPRGIHFTYVSGVKAQLARRFVSFFSISLSSPIGNSAPGGLWVNTARGKCPEARNISSILFRI